MAKQTGVRTCAQATQQSQSCYIDRQFLDTSQLILLLYLSVTQICDLDDTQTSLPTLYWGASSAPEHQLWCR